MGLLAGVLVRCGAVRPLPGLVGVRTLRLCGRCDRLREVEAWRVERSRRVVLRRDRQRGAVPLCGGCLVARVVRLVARGGVLVPGAGGLWLALASRGHRRRGVELVGPLALRRVEVLGGALLGRVQSDRAAEGIRGRSDLAVDAEGEAAGDEAAESLTGSAGGVNGAAR